MKLGDLQRHQLHARHTASTRTPCAKLRTVCSTGLPSYQTEFHNLLLLQLAYVSGSELARLSSLRLPAPQLFGVRGHYPRLEAM